MGGHAGEISCFRAGQVPVWPEKLNEDLSIVLADIEAGDVALGRAELAAILGGGIEGIDFLCARRLVEADAFHLAVFVTDEQDDPLWVAIRIRRVRSGWAVALAHGIPFLGRGAER